MHHVLQGNLEYLIPYNAETVRMVSTCFVGRFMSFMGGHAVHGVHVLQDGICWQGGLCHTGESMSYRRTVSYLRVCLIGARRLHVFEQQVYIFYGMPGLSFSGGHVVSDVIRYEIMIQSFNVSYRKICLARVQVLLQGMACSRTCLN